MDAYTRRKLPGPLVEAGDVAVPAEDADIDVVVAGQANVGDAVLIEEAAGALRAKVGTPVRGVVKVRGPRPISRCAGPAVARAWRDAGFGESRQVGIERGSAPLAREAAEPVDTDAIRKGDPEAALDAGRGKCREASSSRRAVHGRIGSDGLDESAFGRREGRRRGR
jgi:hypothetical protein